MTPFCFHIGYHKTGSTWLQNHFFNCHEDIEYLGISQGEQTNHQNWIREVFNVNKYKFDEISNQVKEKIEYIRLKAENKLLLYSNEGFSGHPWNRGEDSLLFKEKIFNVAPDAIIIVFIRNQISSIRSFYYQYLIEGGLANESQFILKASEDQSDFFSLNHLDHSRLLKSYIKQFGKDKVLVFAYEEFLNNPKYFLSNLCLSLKINTNLDYDSLNINIKLNKSLNHRLYPGVRFMNRIIPSSKNPYFPRWWPKRSIIESIFQRLDKEMTSEIDSDYKINTNIIDIYKSSNQWIQNKFDLNLEQYNYLL